MEFLNNKIITNNDPSYHFFKFLCIRNITLKFHFATKLESGIKVGLTLILSEVFIIVPNGNFAE